MKCQRCGYENPRGKQFCQRCGFNIVLAKRIDGGFVPGRPPGGFTTGTPVAYFKHEKTGKMIPIDKRGNEMGHDPYYSKGDPRGWKRAGKSTKGYERTVHLGEYGEAIEEKKHG